MIETMKNPVAPQKAHDKRQNSLDMSAEEFRDAGYQLVDKIAHFLSELPQKCVTKGEKPQQIRTYLVVLTQPRYFCC